MPKGVGHGGGRRKLSQAFPSFLKVFFNPEKTRENPEKNMLENVEIIRVGFWQNGFFADFYFWAAEFFRGFSRRIFSPHFCGKKCPEKSSRKIPAKSSKIYTTKILRHISAEWPGQKLTQKKKRLKPQNKRLENVEITQKVGDVVMS